MLLLLVQVTAKTQEVADFHMELLLNEAYDDAKVGFSHHSAPSS